MKMSSETIIIVATDKKKYSKCYQFPKYFVLLLHIAFFLSANFGTNRLWSCHSFDRFYRENAYLYYAYVVSALLLDWFAY